MVNTEGYEESREGVFDARELFHVEDIEEGPNNGK
jgi:hypothetical protein